VAGAGRAEGSGGRGKGHMRRSAIIVVLAVAGALSGCGEQREADNAPADALPATAAAPDVLWSAGHETGDLSEWFVNGGGAEVTGSARASVQDRIAHSGRRAMRLDIHRANGRRGDQAIRMFRWRLIEGSPLPARAYYSVWLYFPVRARPETWFNLLQWKTKRDSGKADPAFTLNVASRRGSGAMHLYLYDFPRRRTVATSRIDLPVRRWVQIETFYRWSRARRGHVVVFQDGRVVADVKNVRTQLKSRGLFARQWSVNNYTDSMRPSSYSLFVDDAAITRSRQGPNSWPGRRRAS
jgi:hypothetical protein